MQGFYAPIMSSPFAVPESDEPAPLTVTPPPGQGAVTAGDLTSFFGTVHSLAGASREVAGTWGDINQLGGQEDPPPQPTEKSLRQGPIDEPGGMGFLGLGVSGLVAGAVAGVLVYLLGGNIAWTLIAAVAAALLVPALLA